MCMQFKHWTLEARGYSSGQIIVSIAAKFTHIFFRIELIYAACLVLTLYLASVCNCCILSTSHFLRILCIPLVTVEEDFSLFLYLISFCLFVCFSSRRICHCLAKTAGELFPSFTSSSSSSTSFFFLCGELPCLRQGEQPREAVVSLASLSSCCSAAHWQWGGWGFSRIIGMTLTLCRSALRMLQRCSCCGVCSCVRGGILPE